MKGANRDDLELMIYMALADGVLSTKEWALLVKFAKELGINALELRGMIVGIEKEAALAPA